MKRRDHGYNLSPVSSSCRSENYDTLAHKLGTEYKVDLSREEAEVRAKKQGKNLVIAIRIVSPLWLLLSQFESDCPGLNHCGNTIIFSR